MPVGSPTIVAGMRARVDLTTNREDIDFETGIALLDPNTNPKTLAVMSMGKETTGSMEHHWFEDELFPELAQVNYSTGYNSSATTIVVDDGDIFAKGDLVMHLSTREVMLVTDISTDDLTVVRDYGQDETGNEGWSALAGNITDDDYLCIIGNAFEQGHPLPAIRSTKEVDYRNFHQDVRTPMGMSEINANTDQRGEQDWPFQQRKAGISHMRKLEYIGWWGKPYIGDKGYYVAATGNTLPATAGGINHYLTEYAPANQKKDETELTEDEFQDFMEYVFEYGSATKWCYCPANLRTFIDKCGISKLNTFTKDTMYGMAVGRWLSSHGEVVFVTHKMLKNPQADTYRYAFFLDFEEMKWKTMQNIGSTRLRKLMPYEATRETGQKQEFQTIGSIKYGKMWAHSRLRYQTFAV